MSEGTPRENYSLLPENASPLERAFEVALGDLLEDINAPFPELLDPQRTPPAVLPYLADDRGVGEWAADASVAEQRRTAASAWETQRLAGTRAALELAVESLGFEADLIAWHQEEPRGSPYTLIINALSRAGSLTEELQARLRLRLEQAKAERDSLAVKILRLVLGTTTRPAASHGGFMSTLSPLTVISRNQQHPEVIGLAVSHSSLATAYPPIARLLDTRGALSCGIYQRSQAHIDIYPREE